MKFFLGVFFSLCLTISVFAQKKNTYTCNFKNTALKSALSKIEDHFDIRFSYESNLIETIQISASDKDLNLEELIQVLESKTNLQFDLISEKYYVIRGIQTPKIIKGYLFSEYKQPIAGAVIRVGEQYTISNKFGYFQIETNNFKELKIQHIVYETRTILLNSQKKETVLKLQLKEKVNQIPNINISNFLTKGIIKTSNSFVIKPKKLGIIPGLTEPDILQSIQLLPSVKSPTESATKLHVRGGTPDQNLILWDGIQMFHTGHLFGMVSAFNPYITKKVTFINKGTPAEFGQRVSSTILMESEKYIPEKIRGEAGINLLNTDVALNVPIIKNKLGIVVANRTSIAPVFQSITLKNIAKKTFENTRISYKDEDFETFRFNDLNGKINWHPTENHKFYFSYIYLNNELEYQSISENNEIFKDNLFTRNYGYSFQAKNKWSEKLESETSAFLSKYKLIYNYNVYQDSEENILENYAKRNSISDVGAKSNWKYHFDKFNRLHFGFEYDYKNVGYDFKGKGKDYVLDLDASKKENRTYAGFLQYSYKNSKFIFLDVGLRSNYFSLLSKNYLEPRIVISKPFAKNWKVSFSSELKHQIISQIRENAFNNFVLENQLWTLSSEDKFPIIKSTQNTLSLSYFKNKWYFSTEFYQKKVKGITTRTLGFLNPYDNAYHIGNSTISGLDFFGQKTIHNFKTSFSYSFLRNKTYFENLNDNKDFFANTDIKHAIKWTNIYQLNKIQFALLWTWHTGKPYTEIYNSNLTSFGAPIIAYDEINNKRLPNYSRVDFSMTYDFDLVKKSNIKSKIGFSILNVLNQNNYINREYRTSSTLENKLEVIDRLGLKITPNLLYRVSF
ncbi:FecR domain-containing protein [Aureivirga sp. CE67]|uniref:FecR domain-containing protein n=1 Tax=Aureivirga sp. CE67 TaxID=1788983 RepID=UPI0018C8F0D4|nr:FecR domain-containing protein [Aureivirga sp. CE67]